MDTSPIDNVLWISVNALQFVPPLVVFFFFSSRRRHTRYIGDWSSDVCSSDLAFPCPGCRQELCSPPAGASRTARSEERRVGKEGSLRREPYNETKEEFSSVQVAPLWVDLENQLLAVRTTKQKD